MAKFETIIYKKRKGIVTITLNRPEAVRAGFLAGLAV